MFNRQHFIIQLQQQEYVKPSSPVGFQLKKTLPEIADATIRSSFFNSAHLKALRKKLI